MTANSANSFFPCLGGLGPAGVLVLASLTGAGATAVAGEQWIPAPEFTSQSEFDWLNSAPLQMTGLRDRVVLLNVWTYSCHNCHRSIPWLLDLQQKFDPDRFLIVGIHSPEFNYEHDRRNVARKLRQYRIEYPVMLDNDFVYWKRLNNRWWPAFYLVGRSGRIRALYVGEVHTGTRRAKLIEKQIGQLLDETTTAPGAGAASRPEPTAK